METAIHIEIDALFLLLLCIISWQIHHSVSQQMDRVLFRYVVDGDIFLLTLDIVWMLIDGKIFPGAIALNGIINGIYLGTVVVMDGIWYLYVLERLGHKLTGKLVLLVLSPGAVFVILNLLSIRTGWIFSISENNHYVRGPLFFLQTIVGLLILLISFIHLVVFYLLPQTKIPKRSILKLMSFYIVPFIGTLLTLPYPGMPGTWTCVAFSIVLIHMNDQDSAILRDSLTGMNNRKTLEPAFSAYIRQVNETNNLYLFMLDLNNFKRINDTYGHPVGDEALVAAAGLIKRSMTNLRGIVVRYGGDEFTVMTFFPEDSGADSYMKKLKRSFADWNNEHNVPYTLSTSIGCCRYYEGHKLDELIQKADEALYEDKQKLKK